MAKVRRPPKDVPLFVAYGMGVDSTAILVEFARRGIRPDVILFADTGAEKPETYRYATTIAKLCKDAGWDMPIRVAYPGPRRGPNAGLIHDLYEDCVVKGMLPSIAYPDQGGSAGRQGGAGGGLHKGCSLKWKKEPQEKWARENYEPAWRAWDAGKKVVKVIGYDAAEVTRSTIPDDDKYSYWYPLREWGWNRARCKREIKAAGLPVPLKSACYFCSAAQPHEITWLTRQHPELADRIVTMEACAKRKLRSLQGLWRWPTRCSPATMTEWIRRVRLADANGQGGDFPAYSEESARSESCLLDAYERFGGCVAG